MRHFCGKAQNLTTKLIKKGFEHLTNNLKFYRILSISNKRVVFKRTDTGLSFLSYLLKKNSNFILANRKKEFLMKQGSFMFACCVLALAFCVLPVSAQDYNKSYQTYMVDTFDGSGEVEWTWEVHGSKFATDGYPKLQTFEGMPLALRAMYPQKDDANKKSFLGVQSKFNRMGDNWFDIVPTVDGKPYEIPFKGNVARLDMWVWGADYFYQLEVLVRDAEGRVHVLPIGWLNFKGWKNMGVSIPSHIKQSTRYIGTDGFSLVCFRVRTSPSERVDNFYFFLDEIQALTNVFVDSYDGYELVDAAFNNNETTGEGK